MLATTLAEEVNVSEKVAAEMTNLIELGKLELVRLRCSDLHDHTVALLTRWSDSLPVESKNNCLSAKAQLEALRSEISKLTTSNAVPSLRQVTRMQESCRNIRDTFVRERALAMKRNDEAGNA